MKWQTVVQNIRTRVKHEKATRTYPYNTWMNSGYQGAMEDVLKIMTEEVRKASKHERSIHVKAK